MEIQNEQQQLTAPTAPLFTTNHIRFGTFLGGPLVAGYYFAQNYKAFGDAGRARAAWIYASAATVAITALFISIPQTVNIPDIVFPIAYCWAAYYLAEHLQGAQINAHNAAGGSFFGWGRVIVAGLIGMFITLIFIVILVAFTTDLNG
ncbi:MAG: hypothetical protein V4520_08835 [Bacteroidota bacterium]